MLLDIKSTPSFCMKCVEKKFNVKISEKERYKIIGYVPRQCL